MAIFKHADGQTHYRVFGRKTAKRPPLLCLHGGPGGSSVGLERLKVFSPDRQVIVYDQLGGVRSKAKPKTRFGIPVFVRELHGLIGHLGLENFHLLGASWGTTLAVEYMLRKRPKTIKSLILISPMLSAARWEKDANKLIRKLPKETQNVIFGCQKLGATDAKVYQDALKAFYAKHVCRTKKTSSDVKRAKKFMNKEIYEKMWGPSEFCPVGTLKTYDRTKDLHRIKAPTLIACGQHDESTPTSGRFFAKKMPHAEFLLLKGCSHASLRENPKLVFSLIGSWLKKMEPAA